MGFNSSDTTFSTTQLQDALNRAEVWINEEMHTVFVDGTAATPAYVQVNDEVHTGKGIIDKRYFLKNYPLPDVSTTVSGTAVGTADTTIYVASTNGFPSTGYINIESDKITYTGKTTTTFTGCSGQVSTHGTAKTVSPYIIEISTTNEGQATSWTVLNNDIDFNLDKQTGRIFLNDSSLESTASNTVAFSRFPQYQIANRFRASYIHGHSTIPKDIEWLCLAVASKDLMSAAVRKAHATGLNDYNPELLSIDDMKIKQVINEHKSSKSNLI